MNLRSSDFIPNSGGTEPSMKVFHFGVVAESHLKTSPPADASRDYSIKRQRTYQRLQARLDIKWDAQRRFVFLWVTHLLGRSLHSNQERVHLSFSKRVLSDPLFCRSILLPSKPSSNQHFRIHFFTYSGPPENKALKLFCVNLIASNLCQDYFPNH